MIITLNAINMAYSSDFHAQQVRPVGKATFSAFSFGVPKIYFDTYPVSPGWAQDAVIQLTLDAIRLKAVTARNAGDASFAIEDRLPDFLVSLSQVGRLSKADLESWLSGLGQVTEEFLLARGHSQEGVGRKVDVLHELALKGAAPVPPWNSTNIALLASWIEFISTVHDVENPTLMKFLGKLESLQNKKESLADSL